MGGWGAVKLSVWVAVNVLLYIDWWLIGDSFIQHYVEKKLKDKCSTHLHGPYIM